MFINYSTLSLKYISIYKYKSIYCLAYQAIYRAYLSDTSYTHVYLIILPNTKGTFIIILLLVKINKINLGFALY